MKHLHTVNPHITEDLLRDQFCTCGPIESVQVDYNKACAYITFFNLQNAIQGRQLFQGKYILGQKLLVVFVPVFSHFKTKINDRISHNLRHLLLATPKSKQLSTNSLHLFYEIPNSKMKSNKKKRTIPNFDFSHKLADKHTTIINGN